MLLNTLYWGLVSLTLYRTGRNTPGTFALMLDVTMVTTVMIASSRLHQYHHYHIVSSSSPKSSAYYFPTVFILYNHFMTNISNTLGRQQLSDMPSCKTPTGLQMCSLGNMTNTCDAVARYCYQSKGSPYTRISVHLLFYKSNHLIRVKLRLKGTSDHPNQLDIHVQMLVAYSYTGLRVFHGMGTLVDYIVDEGFFSDKQAGMQSNHCLEDQYVNC